MDAPGASPAIIETRGLAKRYGRTDALVDLTMRVEPGEIFGFLGPNGAGKTTAVKLLLGLARATGGGGTVLGAPLGDRGARRGIGYLPETFRYQPWLRAREVLELHQRLMAAGGGSPVAAGSVATAGSVAAVLHDVGLVDRAEDVVGSFSKGMQQRLGLAVALLGSPRLIVLDEPTSALDPVGRADVRTIIRRARDRGATVLLNSHLLTEVERVCDRIAIVDHGRVLASGRIDDLLGETTVRIQATGLSPVDVAALGRFGPVDTSDDDRLSIRSVAREQVPDIVAAIVAAGGRVHAVDTGRSSLEDLFMRLVAGDGEAGSWHDPGVEADTGSGSSPDDRPGAPT